MKKILALLFITNTAWGFPAGTWTGSITINPQTTDINEYVTLYILPNGNYWGIVDVIPGNGSCAYLVQGNLSKGGVGVTKSLLDMYAVLTPSDCVVKPAVWGSATIVQTSPTTLTWTLKTTLLSATYPLSISASSAATFAKIEGFWQSTGTGYTEIVGPTGAFFSYNPFTGCIASGQYTLAGNLYSFTETLSKCDESTFNGTKNGVATVNSYGELLKQGSWGTVNIFETSTAVLYYGH